MWINYTSFTAIEVSPEKLLNSKGSIEPKTVTTVLSQCFQKQKVGFTSSYLSDNSQEQMM